MPMGHDEDDFPAGTFIECLEDEMLAVGVANEAWAPEKLLSKKPALVEKALSFSRPSSTPQ